jgi:hypothetical protein
MFAIEVVKADPRRAATCERVGLRGTPDIRGMLFGTSG